MSNEDNNDNNDNKDNKDDDKNKKRKRPEDDENKNDEPPKKRPRRSRRLKTIRKDNGEKVSPSSSDKSDNNEELPSPMLGPRKPPLRRIRLYPDKDDDKKKKEKKKKEDKGTDTNDAERSIEDIFSIILQGPFITPRRPFNWGNRKEEEEEEKDYFEIDKEIGEEDEDVDLEEPEPEVFIEDLDMSKLKTLNGLMEMAEKYKDINNKDIKVLVSLKNEMKELNTMVGMKDIKNIVASQIVFLIQKFGKEDMMHTVIQGPPGCGKTSFAKILAKIYLKLGYTKNKKFIVAKRSDLIAGYLGQTAINTQKMINKAKGGILFIDEAYALGPGKNSNGDSFSKECIDTINQNLSENRNFVCIIAGYKEDLKNCFFSRNSGLERRFPWVYDIKEINYKQLEKIFISMVRNNNWNIDENEIPKDFFKDCKDYFPYNGGSVETFFTKVKMVHSKRVFGKAKGKKMNITGEDMKNALDIHKKFKDENISKRNKPPVGMYV